MILPPSLSVLLIGLAGWLGAEAEAPEPVRRMLVRGEIVIHVPIAQRRQPRFEWAERKGPKCVAAALIAGAAMATPSTIDFMLRDRRRVRARLDSDCAGLDFYGGFYVEPRDGAVCAKREEIRSRAGSTCRIERFRTLEAKFKR
jgi:hypothetical protein